MSTNPDQLFTQYLDIFGVRPPKEQQVEEATNKRRAEIDRLTNKDQAFQAIAGRETDNGFDSASEVEEDFRNLEPYELEMKYGQAAAQEMITSRDRARQRYSSNATGQDRDAREIATDAALGIADGAVNGFGGLAAWGLSYADKDVGLKVSEALREYSEVTRGLRTDQMQGELENIEAASVQANRDIEQKYEGSDKSAGNSFVKFLEGMGSELGLRGGSLLGMADLGAQAAGSLVSGSAVGNAVAKGATKAIGRAGAGSATIMALPTSAIDKGAMALSIGAQEAGGVYQQTVLEAYDILKEKRPDLSEDELTAMANETAQMAAETQAPIAALTGLIVAKFEKAPFKQSTSDFLPNVAKEAVEEGAQSFSGSVSSNRAIAENVDPEREWLEGTGREVAAGALGGVAAGGGVQAPGAAVNATGKAAAMTLRGAKEAGKPILDWAIERGQQIRERNENAVAVTADTVRNSISAARAAGQQLRDNFEQFNKKADEADAEDITRLEDAVEFDASEIADESSLGEKVRSAVSGATDRFAAITALAAGMAKAATDEEKAHFGRKLHEVYSKVEDALENVIPQGEGKDEVVAKAVSAYEGALSSLRDNKGVQQAMAKAKTALSKVGSIAAPTAAEVKSPDGARRAADIATAAEVVPDSVDPKTAQTVLEHADSGLIVLQPHQTKALQASSTLVREQRSFLEEKETKGLKDAQDAVKAQILTERDAKTKEPSLAEHLARINSAYRAGDLEVAKARLADLLKFSEHMQNKLASLNAHHKAGTGDFNQGVPFQSLNSRTRQFEEKRGPGVNAQVPRSVNLAQSIAAEARLVGNVANQMIDVFPELGLSKILVQELDPELQGPIEQVVAKARAKENETTETQETQAPVEQDVAVDDASEAAIGEQGEVQAEPAPAEAKPEPTPEPTPEKDEGVAISQADAKLMSAEAVQSAYDALVSRGLSDLSRTERNTFKVLRAELEERAIAEAQPDVEPREEVVEQEAEPVEETQLEPEPTPEPEPAEDTLVTSTNAAAEEVTLATFFPNLLGSVKDSKFVNYFLQTFRLSKTQRSRLSNMGRPTEFVGEVLSNPETFEIETGNRRDAAKLEPAVVSAWEQLLEQVPVYRGQMNKRLAAFVKEFGGKDYFGAMSRWDNGRALNIADEVDGKLVYNEQLADTAILAGIQWLMLARRFQSPRDAEDIMSLLSISDTDNSAAAHAVRAELVKLETEFNKGLTAVEATRSLANMIRSYWGVSSHSDSSVAHEEGIPEAVAKEVIEAMIAEGDITVIEPMVETFGKGGNPLKGDSTRSPKIFIPWQPGAEDPLNAMPDAIEKAVMLKPNRKNWVGQAPADVPETQHNNSRVELTGAQRRAIRARQNVPYRMNRHFLALTEALGREGVLELFASGDINDPTKYNQQHYKTLEGRNVTFGTAFDSLARLMDEIRAEAKAQGIDPTEVEVFYEYTFNRMNRMQMLGADNPQSSKLMREVMMSTWSTVDLNSPKALDGFYLAIAQHTGEKVHLKNMDAIRTQIQQDLAGKYAGSVAGLLDWLETGGEMSGELVQTMKAELGGDTSPAAVNSLIEYARYLAASPEERSEFETGLYLEADGVTNGPMNALALYSAGPFTPEWLANAARGGLFFGTNPISMNEFAESDAFNGDLYEASTDKLSDKMADLRAVLQANGALYAPVNDQLSKLLSLMDATLGSDITFDRETQTLTFKRGIAKNPLTVTIYGSGESGIANKIAGLIARALYERMSQSIELVGDNPELTIGQTMFPEAVNPDAKLDEFFEAIDRLTNDVVEFKKGEFNFQRGNLGEIDIQTGTFSLEGERLKRLSTNLETLFVGPMREAIDETMGQTLMDTTVDIRNATQAQSITLQYRFRQKIDEKIQWKLDNVEGYSKRDFLTRGELEEIWQSLAPLAPIVSTGEQNFYIANSERADTADTVFSQSLSGTLSTPGFVEGPADAGVKGIPSMVIGPGDGMMMMLYANQPGGADRTSDVYDGLNMPIDMIEEFSTRANQAVYQSWQRNPLQALSDSFAQFNENIAPEEMGKEEAKELVKALFPPPMWGKVGKKALLQEIENLNLRLKDKALVMQARQAVMARVGISVDQMASGMSPYHQQGEVSLEGLDNNEIAAVLNEMLDEEYAKLVDRQEELEQVSEAVVNNGIKRTEDGAYTVPANRLAALASDLGANKWQQRLLGELVAPLEEKGYSVVVGSREQIRDAILAEGLPSSLVDSLYDTKRSVNGITLPDSQKIFLIDPTAETLVHELVHGASFDPVAAYYAGQEFEGAKGAEQKAAVERLEKLMEQFLSLDVSSESDAFQNDYANALEAIMSHLRTGNEAAALNEFMAWGLTNENLSGKLSKTKANPAVVLARKVIDAIKQLIWGTRSASPVLDDMLSNLRFNTLVITQADLPAGVQTAFGRTTLFHGTGYGNSPRLMEVNKTFQRKVVSHLKHKLKTSVDEATRKRVRNEWRKRMASTDMLTTAVSNGFAMNAQEKTTFQTIHAALASTADFDANVLSRAAELFEHVTKVLKPSDFLKDPERADEFDEIMARRKYDTVLGNYGLEIDEQERSSLLPTFVALAVTSEEFRQVLATLPLPARERNSGATIDAKLENAANDAFQWLGDYMSGQGSDNVDVLGAMDALTEHLVKVSQERQSFYDKFVTPVGNAVDRLNQGTIDAVQAASEYTFKKAGEIKRKSDNSVVKSAAEVSRVLAGLFNQKATNALAEGYIGMLNKSAIPTGIRELFIDLIGRTETNAPVYDLIKRVRNWVQQRRQQYREHLPELLNGKFSRELTESEHAALFRGAGKADLTALRNSMTIEEIIDMLEKPAEVQQKIQSIEGVLSAAQPNVWPLLQAKAKQLATYMNSGVPGSNLLRNAEAVSALLGESAPASYSAIDNQVSMLDELITLYALDGLAQSDKDAMSALAGSEREGLSFAIATMEALRTVEHGKHSGMARFNAYKGHIPTEAHDRGTIIVARDSASAKLAENSFVRIGAYNGSNLERGNAAKGYYYVPVSTKSTFSQGIMQTVQQTAGGVDRISGLTHGRTVAGSITDAGSVARAYRNRQKENASEPLLPVYDENGQIAAYERSVDPVQLKRLEFGENLSRSLGIWAGRQVEEQEAREVNGLLLSRLKEMYDKDTSRSVSKRSEYVDLFDSKTLRKDKVLADIMGSLPGETIQQIRSVFGENFYVRKDMLNDAMGYRNASVRDLWTGDSRIDEKALEQARLAVIGVFGNDAYKYLVNAEQILQNVVTDLKVMIVVKSVVVPASNLMANVYQLWARGVPMNAIGKGFAKKASEVDDYLRTRERLIDLEGELRAVGADGIKHRKIVAEIQSINDRHRRLSIWPLIEAGEFTSISDATVSHEDITLGKGRLNQFFEQQVDKLPKSAQTAARYGLITRDTALFKGMQRAVEYGDFLAKAVLYDDLTKRQSKSGEHALARVTEEFVNYDRLPGRTRGYLEDMGLMWFWHFKVRSVKVALSMVRNNPLHVLMAGAAPQPDLFGSVGSPLEDNLLSVWADGRLDNSLGFEMGTRAIGLNPWLSLMD